MQVILLEKVPNLGNLGDVVRVKDGFARNFLIPTRAARRATPSAIKEFEDKRVELEKVAAERLATSEADGTGSPHDAGSTTPPRGACQKG